MRQEEIRVLEKLLKEKEELLVPKRKFGFKSKPKSSPVKESKASQDEKSKETDHAIINTNSVNKVHT